MGRFSLEGYTDKCIRMLNDMINPKYVKADKQVPATLIRNCEGIAFISILKAGLFFLAGNAGAGCVLAKVKDESDPRGWRWSGPAAVVCGGLGGGFIFGGEKIDSMIILNTKSAVRAFMGEGQVTFGGNLSLAAGPVGRDIEGHVGLGKNKEIVAAYSYSKAMGLYIGATLEGAFLVSRNEDNKKFYNDNSVTPAGILSGEVRVPLKVDTLHRELYAIHDRKGAYAGLESSIRGSDIAAARQDGVDEISQGLGATGISPGSNATGGEPALAPNWRKVFTADGTPYYHNTATNETSWEPPLAPAPAFSAPAPAPAPASPFAQSQPKPGPQAHPSIPYATPVTSGAPPAKSNPFAPQAAASAGYATSAAQAPRPVPVRPPSQRPPAPAPAPVDRVVALYDYVATRPDELSFKTSDVMTVVDRSDPNWIRCSLNGHAGLVPGNYVEKH